MHSNTLQSSEHGGEGSPVVSCDGGEAAFQPYHLEAFFQAKHHDNAPPVGYGRVGCPDSSIPCTRIQKRSFRRACHRAVRHGCAWYRGRCMTADYFPAALRTSVAAPATSPKCAPSNVCPETRAPQHRFQVVHVNVGGLSSDRLSEIKTWATLLTLDAVLLTETRWSFSSEWEDKNWIHVHMGTPEDRADGLLFLVNKKGCPSARIGFSEVLPGRIGHLRIHYDRRSLDLIGCYQFADTRKTARKQQRKAFWSTLDSLLSKLPQRNSMLVSGDFNCSLTTDIPHVSTSSFSWQGKHCLGPQHDDMTQFHSLLRSHSLLALNTWSAAQPPTYQYGLHASRIDFFLMRLADADAMSRDVKMITTAGFLPLAGAFHLPMLCSLRKIPYRHTRAQTISSGTYQQRMQCRMVWNQRPAQWDRFMEDMTLQWTRFCQHSHDPHTVLDDLHNTLMPTFQYHFPKCTSHPTSNTETPYIISNKWTHRQALYQLTGRRLSTLFRAWHHVGRFLHLKREQQQNARAMKRQKLQDLLTEVHQASEVHDSFAVFQAINKFSPKQIKRRIRLRTSAGTIATSDEAIAMYADHINGVWQSPNQLRYHCSQAPGVPFSKAELTEELRKIPVVKSVARPYVPGIFWKLHAEATADWVYELLQSWWGRPDFHIPRQWKQAWRTFINKPHKSPDRLQHLRPLALQEPIGKCVLALLNRQLMAALIPIIAPWPQFGFCAHIGLRMMRCGGSSCTVRPPED